MSNSNATEANPLPTPRFIGGFEILQSLGEGGMGVVYRARDNSLKRELAIKLQTGEWQQHPEMLQRFLREAQILAKINHPNVVQIFSVGEHNGAPFFAMELLESSIADSAREKLPSIAQCKRWMLEAARGLAAIHEVGVIHRDIKPANLLLTRATSSEPERVKVADLGIASASNLFDAQLTKAGSVLGTSGYLAPEAFRIEHTLDARADQYSLGVVFFELLARRWPFQDMSDVAMVAAIFNPRNAPDVREFRPDVDAETARIIACLLANDPNHRFSSTQNLVQALLQALSAEGGAAQSIPAAIAPPNSAATQILPPRAAAAIAPPQAPTIARTVPAAPIAPQVARKKTGWGLAFKTAAFAASALALSLLGLLWLMNSTPPSPTVGKPSVAAPNKPPLASETPVVTAQPINAEAANPDHVPSEKQREKWANDLISRYFLSSKGTGKTVWTLDLLDQHSGILAAELTGPDTEAIPMTGRVESHEVETFDAEKWDIYQLKLKSADGKAVEMRIESTDDNIDGGGFYIENEQRRHFAIENSEEL
jgi:serine/threonine protein kinase